MKNKNRWLPLSLVLVFGLVAGVVGARLGTGASGGLLTGIASDRGLSGQEAEAALATFVAPGEYDDYLMFASGGHSGQLHVIGVPSMQLLKTIPVFSPDSWSGYGVGADSSDKLLSEGSDPAKNEPLTWGDAHHPALSETKGDYDGRFVYINDRANGRLGMVSLADFKTKQILDIPNIQTSHGGAFVTPNTEYVHVSSMSPAAQTEDGYAPLERYKEDFRGFSTFISIDQKTGKGDLEKSFQIELPPYSQDLADAGKLASNGWAFINSYNTEMAVGDTDKDNPLEVGAIANDYDFLHIINWEKAAEVVEAGNFEMRNGVRVLPLETAIAEGLLYFAPEPRNPHGVDVSPDGNYIVVDGKLDPTATVYSIERIEKAIAEETFDGTDEFGVPILKLEAVREAQVELGAGPLHTQFDDEGNAYTSLFVDSAIAKWSLGPKAGVAEEDAFKLIESLPVQYNPGHLVTVEGDTVSPDGKYMVALNKWSIDRHPLVGTLNPQNFQLIDLDSDPMRILKDMPIGFAEPHYVQMISIDKLQRRIEVYEPGTDALTMEESDVATKTGDERIERVGDTLHVYMTAMRSHFTPDIIRARKGEKVALHITNIETTRDATHGFGIPGYNKQVSLDPGEVVTIEFTAKRSGSFAFYCTEFCSALHLEMQGWLLVEP